MNATNLKKGLLTAACLISTAGLPAVGRRFATDVRKAGRAGIHCGTLKAALDRGRRQAAWN